MSRRPKVKGQGKPTQQFEYSDVEKLFFLRNAGTSLIEDIERKCNGTIRIYPKIVSFRSNNFQNISKMKAEFNELLDQIFIGTVRNNNIKYVYVQKNDVFQNTLKELNVLAVPSFFADGTQNRKSKEFYILGFDQASIRSAVNYLEGLFVYTYYLFPKRDETEINDQASLIQENEMINGYFEVAIEPSLKKELETHGYLLSKLLDSASQKMHFVIYGRWERATSPKLEIIKKRFLYYLFYVTIFFEKEAGASRIPNAALEEEIQTKFGNQKDVQVFVSDYSIILIGPSDGIRDILVNQIGANYLQRIGIKNSTKAYIRPFLEVREPIMKLTQKIDERGNGKASFKEEKLGFNVWGITSKPQKFLKFVADCLMKYVKYHGGEVNQNENDDPREDVATPAKSESSEDSDDDPLTYNEYR
eukprot:TRINITY_DN3583_c0_g1_i1.p1 TRINITY_DN3583_c0_g1~~TRINITY_DN3583_c0_g1_i1.p1  ORF type:complete len:417 (-),score=65.28 TRINITY_DN3583_c0_g1_i1:110-1360(-)